MSQREREDVKVCLEVRDREIRKREKKLERVEERVRRREKEIEEQWEEVEKEKMIVDKAKNQRSHIDVQRLVNRVQQRSFISDGSSLKEDKTKVIKSSHSVTNMNAYLTKCQNCTHNDSGIFKCDLHKNLLNKSQISLA